MINKINELGWSGCDVLSSECVDLSIKKDEWLAVEKALSGGKEFIDYSLKKFDGETNNCFELRKEHCINKLPLSTPIQSMCNLARGSRDQMMIDGADERIEEVCNQDFDNNGRSYKTFVIEEALKNVVAFGQYFVFCSTPETVDGEVITLANEKNYNPFVFGRKPLQVLNYRYANGDTKTQGQFEDILFLTSEIVTNNMTMYDHNVDIAVRMTREYIAVIAVKDCELPNANGVTCEFQRGDLVRWAPNPIGVVPCRMINIGESIVKELVNISSQAMNIQSGAYVGTLDSNYNQKWVAGEQLPDTFVSGENGVLQFDNPDSKFSITENPSGTIDNAIAFNDDLQNTIDVIMQNQFQNLAKKGGNAPSGEALVQMGSSQAQAVGYIMDSIGDALSDILYWMHILAGRPEPNDLTVKMPSTYESTTKKDAVAVTLDMQDVEANSEEGLRVKLIEKWRTITPPDKLNEVIEAELKAELALLKLRFEIDSAGGSLTSGDTINQAEAERVDYED